MTSFEQLLADAKASPDHNVIKFTANPRIIDPIL